MSMVVTQLSIVVIFILIFLGISIYAYRKPEWAQSPTEYFLAGRKLGFVSGLFTVSATWLSGYYILGAVGFTYNSGFFIYFQFMLVFTAVFLWFIGGRFLALGRKFGHITPADLLGHYYDSPVLGLIVGLVCLAYTFPLFIGQVMAAGYAFEGATGGAVPYVWTAVLFVVSAATYSLLGGMRAVAWTDTLQGIFFFAMLWIIALVIVFDHWGGFGGLLQEWAKVAPDKMTFSESMVPTWIYLIFAVSLAPPFMPILWVRAYSVGSLWTWKWICFSMILVVPFGYIPVIASGMASTIMVPGLEIADQAMPTLVGEFFPLMSGLFMAVVFAATMSSADSILLVSSQILTKDFVGKLDSEIARNNMVLIGRVFILLFAALGFLLALVKLELLIMLTAFAYGGVALLFWPFLGVAFWKGGTKSGAIASLIVGTFTGWILFLEIYGIPQSPFNIHSQLWAWMLAGVTFFSVSLMTKNVTEDRVISYHDYLARVFGSKYSL